MSKADLPLQPIPIAYYAGDGCRIFNYDLESSEEAQKWQVTRMIMEEEEANGRIKGCYTPQRLFLDGKWSSDWRYENEAKYQFPSAAAAWEALKRARETETQKQQQGEVSRVDQLSDEEREEREELADELDKDGRYLVEVAFARECNKTWRLATRVIRAAQLLRQSPQGGEVQS